MERNIGSLIKLTRLEKKITQKELSDGICTTSYLSKIENNIAIPNQDILDLLIDRLQLEFVGDSYEENRSAVIKRIEDWYMDLLHGKNPNVNIEEMEGLAKRLDNECAIKFEIVFCKYCLINDRVAEAEKVVNNLQHIVKPEQKRNYFLFMNVLLTYYQVKKKFSQALLTGLELIETNDYETSANEYEVGILYYNIALSYRYLNQYNKSVTFAKLALDVFDTHYYFEKSLRCHIILGISYNNLNMYDKAIDTYTLALKVISYLTEEDRELYEGIIYNNIGYCLERSNDYKNAVNYYKESLKHTNSINERIRTIINLVRCNNICGDHQAAEDWYQEGLVLIDSSTPERYIYQLKIYALVFTKESILEDVIQLQTEAINYFTDKSMWDLVYEYTSIFADIYEKKFQYKRANQMYKLALQAILKLK